MSQQHSPLPWFIDEHGIISCYQNGQEKWIENINDDGGGLYSNEDREFVVRAANCYWNNIQALKTAYETIRKYGLGDPINEMGPDAHGLCMLLGVAIAKSESLAQAKGE